MSTHVRNALTILAFATACSGGGDARVFVRETPPPGTPGDKVDDSEPLALSRPVDPPPRFVNKVQPNKRPPPLSGGTLAIDGSTAVVTDPDRDRISLVGLTSGSVVHLALESGAEPGRITIEPGARAHVVLRRTGEVASIDLNTKTLLRRTPVCRVPRGIAFDAPNARLLVACAEGLLVSLVPETGAELQRWAIDEDARDVVLSSSGDVLLSQFRSGAVHTLGSTINRRPGGQVHVAWRMIPMPGYPDPLLVSESMRDPTPPKPQTSTGYGAQGSGPGDECAQGVSVTHVELLGTASITVPQAVLPIDIATDGSLISVLGAGNAHTPGLAQVFTFQRSDLEPLNAPRKPLSEMTGRCMVPVPANIEGQAVALAYTNQAELIVQSREPAALHRISVAGEVSVIDLGGESVEDVGHAVFHSNSGGRVACASCHAEGSDDGRVWTFPKEGPRRTPSLLGTLRGTAPYHWLGDQANLQAILATVYQGRMQGPSLEAEAPGLQSWLESLPPPIAYAASDTQDAARGKVQFEARCASCHAGPMLTNNRSYAVGAIGVGDVAQKPAYQVPSLVGLSTHAPFMHDGCATTIAQRFDPTCGGREHGDLTGLSAPEKQDLIAYLRSL